MTEYRDAAGNHIRTTDLSSGLRVVTERLPHIRSVALGLAFRIGGRDDPDGAAGTAHLVEHMIFKGTADRNARAISIAAESLGAELNAFTDKEMTVFYGRCPGDTQVPVTELLAEIVGRPAFDETELAKEKSVIAEEVRSTDEDPDSKTINLTLAALYPDQPLGRPVVGTLESVAAAGHDTLRRLYEDRYHAGTCIAVIVGDVRHDELIDTLERRLGHWQRRPAPTREKAQPGPPCLLSATRQELSQVYFCRVRPLFSYADPRRYALSILNSALGGGMSSRLFQRLREDEGLVYSVSSFAELHQDTGLLGVYFVTDRRKLERCLAVLDEEIARLRRERLDRDEFERALNMTKSSVLLALESPASRMFRMARTLHLLDRVVTVDETLDAYNRLTLEDVNRLLDEVLTDGDWHVGAVGPATQDELTRLTAR